MDAGVNLSAFRARTGLTRKKCEGGVKKKKRNEKETPIRRIENQQATFPTSEMQEVRKPKMRYPVLSRIGVTSTDVKQLSE